MSRRLSNQQQRRIAAHQERQLKTAIDETSLSDEQSGLVIAHYGRQLDVEVLHGEQTGQIVRCFMRANIAPLVTGDTVAFTTQNNGKVDGTQVRPKGIVSAGGARRNLLTRPDDRGVQRPIAANIDEILVVVAPKPDPHPFFIDRYLVAADMCGIQPVIICNKIDLLNDDNREQINALLNIYRHIGYTVLCLSSRQGEGLPAVQKHLCGKTCVVVGQSGVGKSSLIKALLPGVEIATGELSQATDKGKHTTTTARLYQLPAYEQQAGGILIDSPGIREFSLPHVPAQELLSHFIDLREHAAGCKFRDCRHDREPHCALLAAEEKGLVLVERMASYRHILASLV